MSGTIATRPGAAGGGIVQRAAVLVAALLAATFACGDDYQQTAVSAPDVADGGGSGGDPPCVVILGTRNCNCVFLDGPDAGRVCGTCWRCGVCPTYSVQGEWCMGERRVYCDDACPPDEEPLAAGDLP